jgi:hypothetical protein
MENIRQRAWRSWASAGLLAVLCAVLAVLQSRWISELSVAERDRLREQLQTGLNQLSADLNERVREECAVLAPDPLQFEQATSEVVYARQYRRLKEMYEPLFRRIGLVFPAGGSLNLLMLDLDSAHFAAANWPPEWADLRERFYSRLLGEPAPPPAAQDSISTCGWRARRASIRA